MSASTPQAKIGNAVLKSLIGLREQKGSIGIEDVGAILENMAATLQPGQSKVDGFISEEIRKLADYISGARAEINALLPEDEKNRHLSSATEQLDAVLKATEHAANHIMTGADRVQAVAAKLGSTAESKELSAAAAEIYEACSFQDITGQRITKVLKTLQFVEERIQKILTLFGTGDESGSAVPHGPQDARPDAHLLHGPQLGDTPSQQDIDKLFTGLR